jgi:hypothetical protein
MKFFPVLASLLVLTASLTRGQNVDVKKQPTAADHQALVTAGWPAAADVIQTALLAHYAPATAAQPGFEQWYGLYRWCDLFSRWNAAPSAESGAAFTLTPAFTELMADTETTRLLFRTLRPEDNARAVVEQLADMRTRLPAKFADYRKLAVALAVVFDQPAPDSWPHHQVPRDKLTLETDKTSSADRFEFWVKSNESGKLLYDLRRLEADEIKFVVATFLPWSELEWARKNVRFSKPAAVTLYSSIRYDQGRLDRNEFSWPHPAPYTLENIRKLGGICVDQAFYADAVAKSRGMPALVFTGEGVRGGHAWAGLMLADNKWDMDCGRYAYDNYATGEAVDPQVWAPINDHELTLLMQRFRDRPDYALSTFHLAIAALFATNGNAARQGQAIDNAHTVCLGNPDAWAAKAVWHEKNNSPPAARLAFLETDLRQIANVPELRSRYARQVVDLLNAMGETAAASRLLTQEMSRNRRERTDLSTSAAAEQVTKYLDARQDTEAFQAYRKALTQLGRLAPGDVFQQIVAPTVTRLHKDGKQDVARKYYDLARDRLVVTDLNATLNNDLDQLAERLGFPVKKR